MEKEERDNHKEMEEKEAKCGIRPRGPPAAAEIVRVTLLGKWMNAAGHLELEMEWTGRIVGFIQIQQMRRKEKGKRVDMDGQTTQRTRRGLIRSKA
jgi:hypothetical protein